MEMAKNTDFIGFTFNERHSSEFNIYSVSDGSRYQDSLIPSPIDYTEQIPGGVGQSYFGSDIDIKEFPLSIAYDKLTETQVRELRNWLAPDAVGELIFDERPYKTYTAKISTSPSLSFICFDEYDKKTGKKYRIYKGEGSINFVCYYPLGITSGEKKNLGWYREQIDDKIYRNIGGSSSIINYKLENKEIAVLEKIKGKTYQKTSKQGKNLVNISDKILTNQTVNGYSGISDKNLLSILDKTKTYIYSAQIDNTLGTTYSVISLWAVRNDVNERLQTLPTVRIAAGQTGISTVTLNGATFDWTGITALYCGVSINANGENVTITVKRFQFEEGSAATSYEPFVPDSPSPDYPSEIIGAQPTVVTVCGRNLATNPRFDAGNQFSACVFADCELQPSTKYTISLYMPEGEAYYTNENLFSYRETPTSTGGVYSVIATTKANISKNSPFQYVKGKGWIIFKTKSGTTASGNARDLQIEFGDTATPYEPYTGQTITLPALASLYGDGTVNDEYDAVSGVETRRWKRVVFDGTENCGLSRTESGNNRYFIRVPDAVAYNLLSQIVCSHWPSIGPGQTWQDKTGITLSLGNADKNIWIYDPRFAQADLPTFKAWLAAQYAAGTPVTVVYQLAEPVITKIEEILPFSNFLPSADSGLIINANPEYYNYFTDSNANISLRLYGAKYSNIDEWAASTGMLEDLSNPIEYNKFDSSTGRYGARLYNPGDRETGFKIIFRKTNSELLEQKFWLENSISTTLNESSKNSFTISARSTSTEENIKLYGSVSEEEKFVANTAGYIEINTNNNTITFTYMGTDNEQKTIPAYFLLKKGFMFKIPVTTTGMMYAITEGISELQIDYNYLYY